MIKSYISKETKKEVSLMLNDNTIKELEAIASSLTNIGEIENISYMRCDCTGGCTDKCFDCSQNSGNQW